MSSSVAPQPKYKMTAREFGRVNAACCAYTQEQLANAIAFWEARAAGDAHTAGMYARLICLYWDAWQLLSVDLRLDGMISTMTGYEALQRTEAIARAEQGSADEFQVWATARGEPATLTEAIVVLSGIVRIWFDLFDRMKAEPRRQRGR